MLQVGVTGGIGSGKSTVCRIFEVLGIPVYYADDRAKVLMVENPELVQEIKALFGEEAYHEHGRLNRKWIADRAFSDPGLLQQLNALVHPAVAKDAMRWHQEQAGKGVPYSIREAALLFESGSFAWLDKIIVVAAPEHIRIERVMKRDGSKKEEVLARMRRQMPETEKVARADYVIHNDGTQSLIGQVLQIHRQLLHVQHDEPER